MSLDNGFANKSKYKKDRHVAKNQIHMYHNDRSLDLSVQRKQARDRTKDGKRSVTIHFHPYLGSCTGNKHETYSKGELVTEDGA